MRLIADIGGTNARFMLVGPDGTVRQRRDLKVADFASFADAVDHYLADTEGQLVDEICVAVAGPVSNGAVKLTNAAWSLSEAELCTLTGARRARLFNDLEAVAFAIPFFGHSCLALDKDRQRTGKAGAPCYVIAPGTGLGAGIYMPARDNTSAGNAFGTEACHARMVLADGKLLDRLSAHVPAYRHTPETFLSGPGLTRLDRALNGTARQGEVIVQAALGGEQGACAVTHAFLDMLARFAGAACLITGSVGGAYLAGGIVRSLAPLIDETRFRRIYNDHPPMTAMLGSVPVYLVNEPDPACLGLSRYRFT